jgi:hypothetical protein
MTHHNKPKSKIPSEESKRFKNSTLIESKRDGNYGIRLITEKNSKRSSITVARSLNEPKSKFCLIQPQKQQKKLKIRCFKAKNLPDSARTFIKTHNIKDPKRLLIKKKK